MPSELLKEAERRLAELAALFERQYGENLACLDAVIRDGRLWIVGSVMVPGQIGHLETAFSTWPLTFPDPGGPGEAPPGPAFDVTVLSRIDEDRLPPLVRIAHPGQDPVPLYSRRVGGALVSEWLPEDGPARLLHPGEGRDLIQLADDAVAWCNVEHPGSTTCPEGGAARVHPVQPAVPFLGCLRPSEQVAADRGQREALGDHAAALAGRGIPYRLGGRSLDTGVDCSAFVQLLIREHTGALLPRHSSDQMRIGQRVARDAAEVSDLVFARAPTRNLMHVGLILEGHRIAHACRVAGQVIVQPVEEFFAHYRFLGARRLFQLKDTASVPAGFSGSNGSPTIEGSDRSNGAGARHSGSSVSGGSDSSEPTAPSLKPLMQHLSGRCVHLVGVSSLEIAEIAIYLDRHGIGTLVGHDWGNPADLYEHFRAAHIGMPARERDLHWEALARTAMPIHLADEYLRDIEEADVVVATQAWRLYPQNEPLRRAQQEGRLTTPVALILDSIEGRGLTTIGVTGSNGKSTTVNLISAALGNASRPHVLGGNYRYRGPILDELERLGPSALVVLELSNHHLMALDKTVDVAVVTNVTRNHLEEHDSFEDYVRVKRRIAEGQPEGSVLVLNADDPISSAFAGSARGAVRMFSLSDASRDASLQDGSLVLRDGDQVRPLMSASRLRVPGRHNIANTLAAALACQAVGIDIEVMAGGFIRFQGAPSRLELVRQVADVTFYDDTESTTPQSTIQALDAFSGRPIALIAGGDNKGLSYEDLVRKVHEQGARLFLLDGSASALILESARRLAVPVELCDTLEQAARSAFERALPDTVVLLSPAAKAFYNHHIRNRTSFERIVRRLRAADRRAGGPASGDGAVQVDGSSRAPGSGGPAGSVEVDMNGHGA